jgi:hypothetical protein
VTIFTSYILFLAPFQSAEPGLHAGDEGFQVGLQACQFFVALGHDIFEFLQPKLQERQFALPQFFFHPVFQLFDESFVHNTPIIDYPKSSILSIIRRIIGKNKLRR